MNVTYRFIVSILLADCDLRIRRLRANSLAQAKHGDQVRCCGPQTPTLDVSIQLPGCLMGSLA